MEELKYCAELLGSSSILNSLPTAKYPLSITARYCTHIFTFSPQLSPFWILLSLLQNCFCDPSAKFQDVSCFLFLWLLGKIWCSYIIILSKVFFSFDLPQWHIPIHLIGHPFGDFSSSNYTLNFGDFQSFYYLYPSYNLIISLIL